jgi:broad specificity phosphatase PhoE
MKLYMIRHLPTSWNLEGKLQGSRDIPIDLEQLIEYRQKVAENKWMLSEKGPFDLVLASNLLRTQQTAELYGYNPQIEPLLAELNFGPFEGVEKAKLISSFQKEWYEDPESLILGESLVSFKNRIITFINRYKDYERILVFGHGSWIRAILSIKRTCGLYEMNHIQIQNNDLIKVDFS